MNGIVRIASAYSCPCRRQSGVGSLPYVGLGDVQSDAQALNSALTSGNCSQFQTSNSAVTAFQQSYNAANPSSQISVDGLYGPQTQTALTSALGSAAPAACVAGASSSSSGGLALVDTSNPNMTYYIIGGVAVVGIAGWLLYRHSHKSTRSVTYTTTRKR